MTENTIDITSKDYVYTLYNQFINECILKSNVITSYSIHYTKLYEYFLGQFALAEGQKGGQFYTPESIVKLLVEMLEPYKGRVYDPCCGSGGMFVQSEKFIESHQGRLDDISVYGQESNQTTYRLCRMNLAIRGIDGSNIKWNTEGSFLNNAHKDLKADYIDYFLSPGLKILNVHPIHFFLNTPSKEFSYNFV